MEILRSFAMVAALVALGAAASAAEPRGPALGTVRYAAAIGGSDGASDVDVYTGHLAAGEVLRVRATSARGSALRPAVALVAPNGTDAVAEPRRSADGRAVSLEPFVVPATGVWSVRVSSEAGTSGAYELRLALPRSRRVGPAAGEIGAEAGGRAAHTFDAAAGSVLDLRLAARGAPVSVLRIVGPAGEVALPAAVTRGGTTSLGGVRLDRGSGLYRVEVQGAPGTRYSSRLVVAAPARASGRIRLGDEPYLAPRAEPLEAVPGAIVRLEGARFAAVAPKTRVWIGDVETGVAAAGPFHLDAVVPPGAEGELASVTVQNPDGQTATRPAHVRFGTDVPLALAVLEPAAAVLPPGGSRRLSVALTRRAPPLGVVVTLAREGPIGEVPPSVFVPPGAARATFEILAADVPCTGRVTASHAGVAFACDVTVAPPAALLAITPSPVTVAEGATQRFTLHLEGPSPPAGIDVVLAATGGIGVLPGVVHVPPLALAAEFDLTASAVRADGVLSASAANTVTASVSVRPPSTIDLSGWTLLQTNSTRSFTLPAGTIVSEGGYVVVARNAAKAEFQSFWGRTFGPGVVFVNSGDLGPSINGAETFELRDAKGASVDGPSIAMPTAAGSVLRRTPGAPAGQASSWTVLAASSPANADPGSGQTPAASPASVYVSEFADALGTGSFVFEFVELHFDRLP